MSLTLAILSWFYITGILHIERDMATRVIDDIGVKLIRDAGRPLSSNLGVMVIPDRINVTLRGRKSVLNQIEPSGITVFIDIANFNTPGRYQNVPIQAVTPDGIEMSLHTHHCEVIIKEQERTSRGNASKIPVRGTR
ncbi:hypothetical protein HY605_01785 [Candidatus Peregrinibacteria bacterium]|nr:hypothetical protein [Candidatus Peregrinibacteria bacterium]